MDSKEAMKLALEALMRSRKAVSGDLDLAGFAYGKNDPDGHRYDDAKQALVKLDKAITALREALAQHNHISYVCPQCYWSLEEQPAQHTWVGLTDDEILYCVELENPKAIAEEVEAKLKEKNT